jgi:hypothetical protein
MIGRPTLYAALYRAVRAGDGQLARLYEKKRKKGSPFLSRRGMQVGVLLAHVNAQELLRIPLHWSLSFEGGEVHALM